ncbi:MAG: HAD hydrolase-like protein, partial [Ignavibacteriae bacterium]|nr:HAD hydrolase-like protein [Ignavibacteriota bacterium]
MDIVILWDFDGVLMDSNLIREYGFKQVLIDFPKEQIDDLLGFHRENGGLSRYVKFRYFFEQIRKENISDQEILLWAGKFSNIMKDLIINPDLLISETISFIRKNYQNIPMHIVSGSDQEELQYICKENGISHYFKSIHGSPTPKKELVDKLIIQNGYNRQMCILIGDSI